MSEYLRFYSVIIGSELLNGRRKDGHFDFLNGELVARNLKHAASFTIGDDPAFMEEVFAFVKNDPRSVMFCFGGIGATPDDYTRFVAAKAFSGGAIEMHPVAKAVIEERFGEQAYPNRIKMAELPIDAELIENPVTKVPGFYLQERFFFVPGFPEMAHPMSEAMLDKFFPSATKKPVFEIEVETSEERFIAFMQNLQDESLDFSSLPGWKEGKPSVVLAFSTLDIKLLEKIKTTLLAYIKENNFKYKIIQGE